MAWIVLFLAGVFEIGWAIGLKYTEGFTRLWPTVGTVVAMVISIGLFLVDAKNWSGNVTAWDGGLYQHLGHGTERKSQSRHAEVLKVHGMASYMAVETCLPTTPVICLAGPSERMFGEPLFIKGVWVVPVAMLVSWLESRPAVLDREAAARAVTRVMTSFPSTITPGVTNIFLPHSLIRS